MSEEAPSSSTHRKLTPAEWEQVVVLWESGSVTLQDLQEKFGISRPSLHEGLKKRGAVKGRRAKEFAAHTEESLKSEAQRKAEKVRGLKSEMDRYAEFIMKMTIGELKQLHDESPRSAETKRRIFTALKYSAEILKIVRDERYHLHDLYDAKDSDGDLPELSVVEYTNDEIDAIKRRFEDIPLLEEDDVLLEEARATLEALEGDE